MKCDVCEINEATVHLTEVVNDDVTKLHLCEECAQEKSEEMQSHFGLTDLLSGLMDFGGPALTEEDVAQDIVATKCSFCGSTYYDFQKVGRLGCGKCYETFSDELSELLRKIHSSDRHVGKIPYSGTSAGVKKQKDVLSLKEELNELIAEEEYEKASILMDKIKDFENKSIKKD